MGGGRRKNSISVFNHHTSWRHVLQNRVIFGLWYRKKNPKCESNPSFWIWGQMNDDMSHIGRWYFPKINLSGRFFSTKGATKTLKNVTKSRFNSFSSTTCSIYSSISANKSDFSFTGMVPKPESENEKNAKKSQTRKQTGKSERIKQQQLQQQRQRQRLPARR